MLITPWPSHSSMALRCCVVAAGETVFHILQMDHIEKAKITSAAQPGPNGIVTYPARKASTAAVR
jgi:hypothetical protein